MLFLFFQISINFLVETIPDIVPYTLSDEQEDYLDFLTAKTNAELDGQAQARSLLDNFKTSIETENVFNDSLIDKFLGVLQAIGSLLKFVFQLILQILFTPTVIMEILLYNFIASSTILFSVSIIVNVFFYMTLFYMVFKARTQS